MCKPLQNKKLSRKEREQLRRRREILEAASRLFSAHGYVEVSMKDIATEAECAVGTLYRLFDSKEAVYVALVADLMDRAQKEMCMVLDPAVDEVQQLRSWVEKRQQLFRENLPLVRLLHEDVQLVGAADRAKAGPGMHERHQQGLRRLAAVFAAGMAKGRFAPTAPPEMLALALDSLTKALCFEELEQTGRGADPEVPAPSIDPDSILQIFFAGLLVS